MNESPIRLADWIAAMRAELTEALIMQAEREAEARRSGHDLAVPPLRVKEIRVDLEVASETERANSAAAKVSLGVRFWVVSSAEVTGSNQLKKQMGTTQKLSLILEPTIDVMLGQGGEPELLK